MNKMYIINPEESSNEIQNFHSIGKITLLSTIDRESLVVNMAKKLVKALSQSISIELVPYSFFANGEINLQLNESIRGHNVYVISDVNSDSLTSYNGKEYQPSLNDRKEMSELLIDTAHKYGANSVNIITTSFPYARQDKPNYFGNQEHVSRKPGGARKVAKIYESLGVKNCITLDIHNPSTGEIFDSTNFINLGTGWLVNEVIEREGLEKDNIILSGTDEGSYKKISPIAKDLSLKKTITFKQRDDSQPNTVEEINVLGNIKDKNVIIYDDMIDTGGTLSKVIEKIYNLGSKTITVVATHGMFNSNAYDILDTLVEEGKLSKIYVTNSIHRTNPKSYIEYIDISNILTHSIASLEKGESIDCNNNKEII